MCSVTFRALSPDSIIALAAETGIAAIEWGADVHVPPGRVELARQIAGNCADAGVRVSSYGSYVEAGIADHPVVAVLESAAALGAATVRVWAGRRGVGSAQATPAAREATVDALQAVADRAAPMGLQIALEYHPRTLTDTAESTLQLIAAAGRSNLVSYWQPRPGIGLAESLTEISLLAGSLSHLHVFAWNGNSERLALAAHDALWLARLRASREIAMPGSGPRVAMLEFVAADSVDAFRRDAATLVAWLEAIDRT